MFAFTRAKEYWFGKFSLLETDWKTGRLVFAARGAALVHSRLTRGEHNSP
jgi:hypothetical protein